MESNKKAIEFQKKMKSPPPLIFTRMEDMHGDQAFDAISSSWQVVPCSDMAIAGFLCKARSPLNNQSTALYGCISSASGGTGESFQLLLGWAEANNVAAILCENVPEFADSNTQGECCLNDAADRLALLGLKVADHAITKAGRYGTVQSRKRLFFPAIGRGLAWDSSTWTTAMEAFKTKFKKEEK